MSLARMAGGFAFAGVLLLVTGFALSSAPAAKVHAQAAECPDAEQNARCLVIIKDTSVPSAESFSFTHTKGGVDTDFELSDGEQAVFLFTDTQTHTVVEHDTAGWDLANIICEDQGVDLSVNVATGTLTVTMDVGEDPYASAVCTFANEMEETATPTETVTETVTETSTPTETATQTETATTTPTATSTTVTATATTVTATATTATATSTTATSVATTAAPKPPATGSGPGSESPLSLALVIAGVAIALGSVSLLAFAARKR